MVSLSLPSWVQGVNFSKKYVSDFDKMTLAIELSQKNVAHKTGGPFGAAIFAEDILVAVGVNRVVPESCSIAHAEMMAFAMAQKHYKNFDLGDSELPTHTLATSSQMCAMCFGASIWSGVRRIIYGATARDVESIVGFDEGPIVSGWQDELEKRGIEVVPEIARDGACAVLQSYRDAAGIVYNGRRVSADK